MDLGKWTDAIDEDQHEEVLEAAKEAAGLGKETYSKIVMEAANGLAVTDEFWYLAQTLIMGNIAFGAQAKIKMRESGYIFEFRVLTEDDE